MTVYDVDNGFDSLILPAGQVYEDECVYWLVAGWILANPLPNTISLLCELIILCIIYSECLMNNTDGQPACVSKPCDSKCYKLL